MDLAKFETMDPVMLMSIVNMKLRDDFDSLEDLVRYFDIDAEALKARLQAPVLNTCRSKSSSASPLGIYK